MYVTHFFPSQEVFRILSILLRCCKLWRAWPFPRTRDHSACCVNGQVRAVTSAGTTGGAGQGHRRREPGGYVPGRAGARGREGADFGCLGCWKDDACICWMGKAVEAGCGGKAPGCSFGPEIQETMTPRRQPDVPPVSENSNVFIPLDFFFFFNPLFLHCIWGEFFVLTSQAVEPTYCFGVFFEGRRGNEKQNF